MSTQVNVNVLKKFLVNELGIRKLDHNQAEKYDIDAKKFAEADVDENGIELQEILNDKDLYAQFATLYTEMKEVDNTKDKEKQKEEENKVDAKSGAGNA